MMQVQDRLEIQALVDRYSDAANRQDAEGMAAVYAEHGRLIAFGNEPYVGRDTIREIFRGSMAQVEYLTQVCAAGMVDIQGDRATARWTITEFAKHTTGDKLTFFLGTYEDVIIRTAEGWLFGERVLKRTAQARFEAALRS
jgi:uncharacterized protein (TIGR02246 family)